MNIENQIKKIDELVRKGNKASYKLALDKITNLQKKIPPNSFIQNLNGIIVQKLGGIKDSIKYYEKSHKINDKNISPLNNLSFIYELLKEWDLALLNLMINLKSWILNYQLQRFHMQAEILTA